MAKSLFSTFLLLLTTFSLQANQLTVLNWPDYMPLSVIKQFEKENSINVTMVYFESDEQKDALLNATDGSGYDVIVSSLFRTNHYIKRQWLSPIENQYIPNLKHLDKHWFNEYQNSNQHCVPYLWGSLGLTYNKTKLKPVTSWQEFYSTDVPSDGKLKLISDSRDVLGTALISQGFSLNDYTQHSVNKIGQLIHQKINKIGSVGAIELSKRSELISGDVTIAMTYNGDGLYLASLDDNLEYVTPTDGSPLWLDCLTLAKSSQNKEVAHKFVNFIHQPEISAEIANALFYATPNDSAIKLLPKEFRENKDIFLTQELLDKSGFHQKLAPEQERLTHTMFSQLKFAIENHNAQ